MKKRLLVMLLAVTLLLGVVAPVITLAQEGKHEVILIFTGRDEVEIKEREVYYINYGETSVFQGPKLPGYTLDYFTSEYMSLTPTIGETPYEIRYKYGVGEDIHREPERSPGGAIPVNALDQTPQVPEKPVIKPDFKDVKPGAWYEKELDKVSGTGIISGIENSKGEIEFRANDTLTHAQLYTMLARLFGTTKPGEKRYFEDLNRFETFAAGKQWYTPYVEALELAKMIEKGMTHEQLSKGITRLEAIQLITRLTTRYGAVTSSLHGKFNDTYNIMEPVINIVEGYPNGDYGVADILTRAQAVALIARTLGMLRM